MQEIAKESACQTISFKAIDKKKKHHFFECVRYVVKPFSEPLEKKIPTDRLKDTERTFKRYRAIFKSLGIFFLIARYLFFVHSVCFCKKLITFALLI
ncbi:hypothetical protein CLI69_04740 [Prevotella intermedia]|nr:hypothetical protein CLI69_04740 [Prevotella intermedia]